MKERLLRCPLAAALLPLLGTSLALAATVAWADDTVDPATPQNARQLQQVVVTGTRSTNRTEAESLAPIDVLTPADLTASGSTDLASALSTLLPSLDFPRPAINDGNDAIRPATLRGLSPDQVLVLVDGKRYHTTSLVNYNSSVGRGSAPVDLNSIPIAAIDHIEVLRDGATAQYGSDAIAGVINVVLKHGGGPGTNSITATGGVMDKGDGAQNGIQGSVGIPLSGPEGSAPGWVRLAWNYQNAMNTNRAENKDVATTIAGAPNPSGIPYERYGDPAVKTYQMLLNFGYNLTPNIELYGYLNASKRDVTSNGYYRAYNSARNVPQIYPNGFLPQIINHSNDIAAVVGVKGKTDGGWRWDLSADYGENNLGFDIQNSVNTNLYNTLGYSPTYFNAGTFRNKQGVVNLDLSKDFNWGFLPNPVTVAFGGEYRKEKYVIDSGDPDSYFFDPNTLIPGTTTPYAGGSQVYPGLTPSVAGNFGRHSEAAYVDMETDLTSKLSAGVAARYENYSDAGSTRSGKISARYQFTDTFALRGTVSNGFRAPSLAQQNYESVVTLIQNGQLAQIGTFRTSDPAAIALGAKPLKPEKSTNYGLGAVWQPLDNFSATLDLYQIRIWNQILYSDQIAVDPTPTSQVTGAQFFVNGATSRTRGADLLTSYRLDFNDYGKLNLTFGGNYNKTKVLAVSTPAFGRASQGLLTDATPHTKYVFGADWLFHDFNLHGNLTRYGSVTRRGDAQDGSQDQTFSSRWLLDLAASYNLKDWTFTVGADNVTNQYPTKAALNNVYEDRADGLQYSALSPFGFNGRYLYGRVTFRF
ncbi:iron complex outermembrane receptor protein [Luteibacter rhizovicinus]|uniref:Iron complex outermembrane receptor protein n=1 Tax=Luteibacter rhizovicinus TaxID=242606 RepID=A0A4R3YV87_9GAMM|nr:TonB-dependent receptor [Luteibacter rhizovicinus]TCV96412.1 iron complex outermembrane receptor protein [Luteibacter rhizovicinus]